MTYNSEHCYAVVVAGGAGTRLWPLSRQALPKQMQSLMSDQTLIAETVERLRGVVPIEHVFISTTENYREHMQQLLPEISSGNFIIEPEPRGTPAAFALLAERLRRQDPDAVVFTLASDHAITEVAVFQETMRTAFGFIDAHPEQLAIVGITPTRPDTGLGYIRAIESVQADPAVLRVAKYAEKPTQEVAQSYVDSGTYYWNAAYYCFRADTLLAAYAAYDKRLVEATSAYLDSGHTADYLRAPAGGHEIDIIDTAKTPLALVPADFTWSDIGNWAALYRSLSELMHKDVVVRNADHHTDEGSTNSLVINTDDRIVTTAGLDHIAVITTEDAVLVVDLRRLEEMPEMMLRLFEKLRREGKGQYL
jgi:mannose-1-phosphate guanylyltransferase/mannose-6-phosphate isomerase